MKIRVDPAELAAWRAEAEQRGASLSGLIRASVRGHLSVHAATGHAPPPTIQPAEVERIAITKIATPSGPTRSGRCSKSSLHRAGQWCGYCRTFP